MTATVLISGALRLLGEIVAPGQTAAPEELAEGLTALNAMLDNWSTERLNIYAISVAAYTLVTTQQVYGIGPAGGATFAAPRPIKIELAAILSLNPSGALVRSELELIDQAHWQALAVKSASSSVADRLYYDHGAPNGNLYLWPVPVFTGTAPQLELSTWAALAFADLTTPAFFAAGYELAIRYNLAVQMASLFGVEPTAATIETAREAKAAIRAINAATPDGEPPTGALNALPEGK